MNTLERLRELNATTGKRNGNEDLGHWADREKHENMWVREVALPDLIEVVAADVEMNEIWSSLENATMGNRFRECAEKAFELVRAKRDAALAKLTEEGKV